MIMILDAMVKNEPRSDLQSLKDEINFSLESVVDEIIRLQSDIKDINTRFTNFVACATVTVEGEKIVIEQVQEIVNCLESPAAEKLPEYSGAEIELLVNEELTGAHLDSIVALAKRYSSVRIAVVLVNLLDAAAKTGMIIHRGFHFGSSPVINGAVYRRLFRHVRDSAGHWRE